MPLRIEAEELWRRLQVRFKARLRADVDIEDPPFPILLETLQPVTDFDALAKEHKIVFDANVDMTSGAPHLIAEVPAGKRWQPIVIRKAGSTGVHDCFIVDDSEATECVIDAGSTAAFIILDFRGWLEEYDEIRSSNDDAGDGAIRWQVMVVEEDAF